MLSPKSIDFLWADVAVFSARRHPTVTIDAEVVRAKDAELRQLREENERLRRERGDGE